MAIYIDEVIEKLEKIRTEKGNIEVCKVGHYGEINDMHLADIEARMAFPSLSGGKKRWVINFDTPDIGPDPD